ncbi:protein kinase domain-containing protein, partial [Cystoisospora suis]
MQGRGNCQTPCPQQGTSPDRSSARVQAQLSSRARDLSGPRQPRAELPASANPAMPVCRAPSPSSSVVGGLGPSTTFFSHAGLSSVGSVASRRSARSLTAKETRAQLKQVFNEFAVPRRVPSSSSLPLVELFCRKCGGRREKVLDRSALLALFSHLPAMVFERFFDLLDEDGDQTVDVEEFLKGVDMLCGRDDQQLLRFLFKLCDLDGNGRIEREELRTLLYHLPSRLWRFSTGTIKKKNKKQQALLSVPGKAQYEKRNECRRRTVPPALDTSPVRREGRRSVVHFAADIVDTEDEAQQNSEKEEDDEGEAQDDDDEERGDALVFDARDELVRKRIDEIVEAAFRCKQQKTRSRVRAATAPPRNLLGGDSCPGDMIPEDRGRKPSEGDSQASAFPRKGVEPRRAVHSGRPTSRDEGLTFEEFLSSLDSNREILDLLNFFYIQSVLSLFAPRGPPLTLSVSFASGGSTPADPTARSRSTSPHVQSVASTLEGRSLLKASSASSSSRENSASLCPPLHSAAARKGDQLAGGRRCSPSRSATAMSSREAQDSSQAVQEVQKLERAPASIELPESTSHRSSVNHTENSHHGAFTVFSVDGAEVRARGSPDQFRKEGSLGRSAARPPGRERFQSVGCAAVNRSLEPMEGEMLSAKKAESSARRSGRKLRR